MSVDLEYATVPQILGELRRRHKAVVCIRIDRNDDVLLDLLGGTMNALGMVSKAHHMLVTGQVDQRSSEHYGPEGG